MRIQPPYFPCAALAEAVIVIDDFEVPGDSGYTFDCYGDEALTVSFLETTGARHTGALRGWVVLTQSRTIADTLQQIGSLAKC
jgi:hypothetical protein